jgi:hypothetical protein
MRILLATLLLPLAAQAITITSTSGTGTPPQIFIGKTACNSNTGIPFLIDTQLTVAPDPSTITVGVTRNDATCRSSSGGTLDRTFTPTFSGTTATVTIFPSDILNTASGDAGVTSCSGVTGSTASPAVYFVCAEYRTTTVLGTTVAAADMQINFATVGPTPPTQPGVAPGDGALRVSWQPGNSAESPFIEHYDVHVVPTGQAVDLTKRSTSISAQTSTDATVTDDNISLVNGSLYDVSVAAIDKYGNMSALSTPFPGAKPVPIDDFYNTYRNQGGHAQGGGGCGSAGGLTWIAGLALAAALLARRRRKARAGLLGALLLGALALPAQAASSKYDRAPRKLLFELKLDRYSPQVDSEAGLTGTPYRNIFGSRRPLRWQLEVDWEVAHPFGSLLIGGTVGYWQNIGKGLLPDGTPSQDTALLDVIPFGAVVTYRFDYLADRFRWFPLIPYAQAGLSRALWASFNGRGDVSRRATGGRGSGWTNGYTTALGVAFALDALDPDLSREAYSVMGIQRTSIFAEYGWTRLDNFRSGNALILSDRAWRFGLSLEF